MRRLAGLCAFAVVAGLSPAAPQVIEFESNGLKYQTLTKSGVTVMFAHMPTRVRQYSSIQVAISNGSRGPYVIKPEDFVYQRELSGPLRATGARTVVGALVDGGSRGDVIRLVSTYEASLYGISRMRSTNGYEQRRQAALAETSVRLKAAAAASAIALVQTKLAPGESTDGAVFFSTDGKPIGPGRLVVRTNSDLFEFNPE
jgi:hypothetical protein